jgi:hypothetical protein
VGRNAVVPLVNNCDSEVPVVSTVIMLLLPTSGFIIVVIFVAILLSNVLVGFSSGFSRYH